jgi:hypothetical protein
LQASSDGPAAAAAAMASNSLRCVMELRNPRLSLVRPAMHQHGRRRDSAAIVSGPPG